MERTLEQAIAYAKAVARGGHNHCLICDEPKNEPERRHSERYLLQLNADAYCVLLNDELKRCRAALASTSAEKERRDDDRTV